MHSWQTLISSVVTVAAVTGCAAASEQSATDPASDRDAVAVGDPYASGGIDPQLVLDAFKFIHYDFEPVNSNSELLERAEIAAIVELVDVVPGRTEGDTSGGETFMGQNSGLRLRVVESVKGARSGEEIWVEVATAPELIDRGLPDGTQLAVFVRAASESRKEYIFGEANSEVPQGARLYAPVHPEAVIVRYGVERGTVLPLAAEIREDGTLAQAIDPKG